MDQNISLADYHISEKYGFLLEKPLETIPAYFEEWQTVGLNLPELIESGTLRQEVDKMSLLDHTRLSGHREQRLAYMLLAYIGNAYVWVDGDLGVPRALPSQVAVPLCALADMVGSKPLINHSVFCLSNWKVIDSEKPLEIRNMDVICRLPGGEHFRWFVVCTAGFEMAAAPAIKAAVHAQHAAQTGDVDLLMTSLASMTTAIRSCKACLIFMQEVLSPSVFYDVVRPFLSGWGGANSPLQEGLIYEGVSDIPKQFIGGSAAQSTSIATFDAVLGVEHTGDTGVFLQKMVHYMPRSHREFLQALRSRPPVKDFVERQDNERLREAYNECVQALTDLRSYHIRIVTRFIVQQSHRIDRNVEYEAVAQKGTGGTDLIPFLRGIRDRTKMDKIVKSEAADVNMAA